MTSSDINRQPQVSVLMLVYQHQDFLSQAIDSVLTQQCSFDFELIIINDASADASGDICQQYADQNPETVRFIDNDTNLGMHTSFAKLWNAANAPFVAFCEGDDYWIDDFKLQKQFDLLSQTPEINLVGAKAGIIEKNQQSEWKVTGEVKPHHSCQTYSFSDLISSYHFHFSTVMLRKSAVNFPGWFQQTYCVDRPLYLLACEHSNAAYIDSMMSHYRIHQGGAWSSNSGIIKANKSVQLFKLMEGHFNPQFKKQFDDTLFEILFTYVSEDMARKNLSGAKQTLDLALSCLSVKDRIVRLPRYYKTWLVLQWQALFWVG